MRQRDLLPLRLPFREEAVSSCIGRSTRRRIQQKLEWESWAHEGVETLNQMYLGSLTCNEPALAPVASQARALEEIIDDYR